jgi:signal transduction histidine kinase/ABC-type amino acid transport substrate-binding protein
MFKLILYIFISTSCFTETVNVGVFHHPPAVFLDDEGNATGFFPELLGLIAKDNDWTLKFVPGTWNDGIEGIKSKKLDLINYVGYAKSRTKFLDYTNQEVMMIWGELFVQPNSTIDSVLDIKDKTIAIMKGDINGKNFKKLVDTFAIPYKCMEFPTYPETLQALSDKKVDAAVTNNVYGYHSQHLYAIKRSSVMFSPISIHFACPKNSYSKHLKFIDQFLEKAKKLPGSAYYQLKDKWNSSTPKNISLIPLWIYDTLAGFFILLLLYFLWNRKLQKEVLKRTQMLQNAHEQLTHSETLFKSYFELGIVGMFVCDHNLVITDSNIKLSNILNYSNPELKGKSLKQIFDFSDNEELTSNLDVFNADEFKPLFCDLKLLKSHSESQRYVSLAFRRIENPNPTQNPVYIGLALDLDQRIKAANKRRVLQNALATKASQLQNILNVASKGFSTPLSKLLDTTKNLKASLHDFKTAFSDLQNPKLDDYILQFEQSIGFINKSCLHLDNLAQGFLATNELGFLKTTLVEIDMIKLCHSVIDNFQFIVHERDIDITIMENLPKCHADHLQLEQVIQNLIDNSIKYIPHDIKGKITITGKQLLDKCEYTIKDNGIGIPSHQKDKIFQVFYKHSPQQDTQGFGVGLSIVKRIIDNHNGFIEVDSNPNQGFSITLTLPRHS